MSEPLHLETLMRKHTSRWRRHAALFTQVMPEAVRAQDALMHALAQDLEARRHMVKPDGDFSESQPENAEKSPSDYLVEAFTQRLSSRKSFANKPLLRMDSHAAMARALQPVHDIVVEDILVLGADKRLDLIGLPYPDFWIFNAGNAFPALQSIWANPTDGAFGFSHEVTGTVTGRQAISGAGIYVQFVPRIAPGIAQIRPFAPFSYQWLNVSFKSREDNAALFGIRVWSWDLSGGDFFTEQDYRYFIWQNTSIANYFATSFSPSWEENQDNTVPEWDTDHAFLFGKEAPYFKTRPNRIYMAAIWCLGTCWSVSSQNRPGLSIGRLHAKVPWVVIGYQ